MAKKKKTPQSPLWGTRKAMEDTHEHKRVVRSSLATQLNGGRDFVMHISLAREPWTRPGEEGSK